MEAIVKVGTFTTNLVNDTNIKVKRARSNHQKTDFTKDLILVDNLGGAIRQGGNDKFDGDNEVMSYNDGYIQAFTFDFYGNNAYLLATRFVALLKTQNSFNLQKELGLTFKSPSNITDVRQQTGVSYFDRYQIEINVNYWDGIDIDTLRMDELQLELFKIEQ